jgi:hypothetical protein
MSNKDFQQQLLYLINKIEKIEDLCKENSMESFGPYPPHIEYNKLVEDSKYLTYTDGHIEGQSHLARKILRILYS